MREAMDALIGEAARRRALRAAGSSKQPSSAIRSSIISFSVSTRPTRRSAVRSMPRRGFEARTQELGLDIAPGAFFTRSPASPALRRGRLRRRAFQRPALKDKLTFWSTSAPMPRSCSAIRAAARLLLANRAGLFEARDLLGQRAAPGAIERVRIDRETLEPRSR